MGRGQRWWKGMVKPHMARESSSHREGTYPARFGLLMLLSSRDGWWVPHVCDTALCLLVCSQPRRGTDGQGENRVL